MDDLISRQAAIDEIKEDKIDLTDPNVVAVFKATGDFEKVETQVMTCDRHIKILKDLPSAQPESKYEYHYDHTDCIWYRPEARNRCPSTCAQYRDGWNDAMNYIFRDGEGYRPFRRDKKYEG